MLNTYNSPPATFLSNIWSNYAVTLVHTTNSCESYYSRLNQRFYNPHSNNLNFIDELLEIQSEAHVNLRSTNQEKKSALDNNTKLKKQMTT